MFYVLRRHADRTNWAVGLGPMALTFGTYQQSWSAGLVSGLGAMLIVYGCVCYANGKGHGPVPGALLGAAWVSGMVLFQSSDSDASATLSAALSMLGLLGLALLRPADLLGEAS